jgi:phosphoribosylpyrophosphate synthetase
MGGSSLGREISSHLDIALGRHETSRFNDGEISMQIFDSVSGHKVVILKTFENQSINEGLMELLLAISTMKKNGASHVTVVFPYFPYTINVIDKNCKIYDRQNSKKHTTITFTHRTLLE